MIIRNPISTEKAIRLMESENKLTFEVARKATKAQIAHAFEEFFSVKPVSINTAIRPDGKKRAIVTLPADAAAIDIATNLGLL